MATDPASPVPAADTTKPPARERPSIVNRMIRLSDILGALRTILTSVAVFAALTAVVGLGIRETLQNATVIDPIELPKDLVDVGYSPQVFAARLGDERQAIYKQSKTRAESEKNSADPDRIVNEGTQANLDIPGTGLSVKSVIRFGRQVLGLPETHIGGDATHEGQDLVLVLRSAGGNSSAPVRVRASDVNDLLRLGAREVVKMIEPYILAAYTYEQEVDDGDFTTTLELIQYCLDHPPASDDRPVRYWKRCAPAEGRFGRSGP